MARTRLYRDGRLVLEDFPVEDVSDHLAEAGSTVWLDLLAPGPAEMDAVAAEFGLHELAIEDALHEHQRPKLDRYADHAFVSAYALRLDETTGRMHTSEISAFVTPSALITVRADDLLDVSSLTARWDAAPDLAKHGVGFLLWGLLDLVVDGHFDAVQQLDDSIEQIEDLLFEESGSQVRTVQRRSFALRKSLVLLRRVVLPMREVVNALMRRDLHLVDEAMTPYLQDVYDHVLRVTEWTESLRDLVSTILETNLTIQGNRMNLIMKKVTSWAAIIAVPTAITGFYGQNLPYPGFAKEWGFVFSSALIVVMSVGLYVAFKKAEWL